MVEFSPHAEYRPSKRGLVLAGTGSDTVLLEHPRANELPDMLATNPSPDELLKLLGPPVSPDLVTDLIELGVLTDTTTAPHATATTKARRVTFSRSGIMIDGIATPARVLNRGLTPFVLSTPGRVVLAVVVVAGVVAFAAGRPDLPQVSSTPAAEALLMITIGTVATVCHEMGHAVALVHYGRTPRRAGFGFYWGALSFFVDSTPAMTLRRNQRVLQALIGLAVDVVTTAAFFVAAQLVPNDLLAAVFWRTAALSCVYIALNVMPVLQVDGHWALADWLDEPDLGPRARSALGLALRRQLPTDQRALAAYGAVSLAAGLALFAVLITAFWATTGELVVALFTGNAADIAIGIYYVGPLALGILFSTLGLILETLMTQSADMETEHE